MPLIAAAGWPLRDCFEFGPALTSVRGARLRTRIVLAGWGQRDGGDATLIVSELVANSIAAARSLPEPGTIRLWLLSDTERILVVVTDPSPEPPSLMEPDPEAEHGRGLLLVQAFSTRWGWCPWTAPGAAKAVWAEIEARLPAAR